MFSLVPPFLSNYSSHYYIGVTSGYLTQDTITRRLDSKQTTEQKPRNILYYTGSYAANRFLSIST